MSKTASRRLKRTAYHEAGHAAVLLVYDLPFDSVTIKPTEDSTGGSRGHILKPNPMMFEGGKRERNQIVRQYIVSAYAGFEAERCFDPNADEGLSEEDFSNAWNLPRDWDLPIKGCSYIGDEVYEQYLARQRQQARALVRKHWALVERLAQALLERETLSGEQAESLVRTI